MSAKKNILSRLPGSGTVESAGITHDTAIEFGTLVKLEKALIANACRFDAVSSIDVAYQLVNDFLNENDLRQPVAVCPELQPQWPSSLGFEAEFRSTQGNDLVCISLAYAALEDTGTLVLLSSKTSPVLLNFLSDYHIIFLPSTRLLKNKSSLWATMRQENRNQPRALNFISGPSRTADIEQTIQLGAHGPRSLWIIAVN